MYGFHEGELEKHKSKIRDHSVRSGIKGISESELEDEKPRANNLKKAISSSSKAIKKDQITVISKKKDKKFQGYDRNFDTKAHVS